MRASGPHLIDILQRGGADVDQDLAITSDGVGEIFAAGRLAEGVEYSGFHRCYPFARARRFVSTALGAWW